MKEPGHYTRASYDHIVSCVFYYNMKNIKKLYLLLFELTSSSRVLIREVPTNRELRNC